MSTPMLLGANDIFLQPGELHFGERSTRIRTVLGSCVAMVFWHPLRHVGGMCHYMLPSRAGRQMGTLDGRYANEAVALLFSSMARAGTRPAEYQVKLFGGANMFPSQGEAGLHHVGLRNVEAARDIVAANSLVCVGEHLAGAGHRNVIFEVWSGRVWIKHESVRKPAEMAVKADDRLACAA
jgi:chemotaxis protein CheD